MRRAFVGLVLVACSSGTEPAGPPDPPGGGDEPGVAALVAIVAGDDQRAPVGTELPQAVVVRVTDARALAVESQIVSFVVVSGGGRVFAGTAQTNASGEARERWTLGTSAGEQILEARAVDQDTGEPIVFSRVTAIAEPGPAQTLALDDDEAVVFLGEPVDLAARVTAADQHGNPITDPALELDAPAPFVVAGTTVASPAEASGTITVRSGEAEAQLQMTALRPLADLVGATGAYVCYGDIPTANQTWPRLEAAFVVDSVALAPAGAGGTLWVTQTETTRQEDGSAATVAFVDGVEVSVQEAGRFFVPRIGTTIDERWAVQVSDQPLTYQAGPACSHLPNATGFEPWTLTGAG